MAALFTPTLITCLAITSAVHIAVYMLNTTLPLHMVALGASKTQVDLLFSVGAGVSMVMRPLVGGWIDRYGFRPVMLRGALVLVATLLVLPMAGRPGLFIALMAGLGMGIALLISSLREVTPSSRSDQRFRWLSRRALPAAATVVAVNSATVRSMRSCRSTRSRRVWTATSAGSMPGSRSASSADAWP